MTDINQITISLREAFSDHLTVRSISKSVSSLLNSRRKKINYAPYYQRNYVWDNDKATYFIESILLGIEIPPLIMFVSTMDSKTYEVIDGRQRFETLKRFFENDFRLSKKGLKTLTALQGMNFSNLDSQLQSTFLNTTLRTIEFSTVGKHEAQETLEDKIKKEIFFRYNSGITPLKNIEVGRAMHLEDNFTVVMEEEFKSNPDWLATFKKVFFAKNKTPPTDTECQQKIRELIVMAYFPINVYATTSKRRETIEWLYDNHIEQAEDQQAVWIGFQHKITLIEQVFEQLDQPEWMIYQGIYWLLVVMEHNDVDIDEFFTAKVVSELVIAINNKLDLFIGDQRGFSRYTNERFSYLTEFCNQQLKLQKKDIVSFNVHLSSTIDNKDEQEVHEVKSALEQLEQMRLTRPDAVTKTVEDLLGDLGRDKFLIRPSYQREEVINIKKASGIIESILLGIPLPTIFVYRRSDGVSEVVDGQQRILSILAYIAEPYKNHESKEEYSKKNGYALSRTLKILESVRGQKFDQLEESLQDRIWDFELSIVYIEESLNSKFNPIELFIRLNSKPYPVKNDSFEIWNSYVDRSIVTEIKALNERYHSWFYYRKDNRRMIDEELLTIFTYLHYLAANCIDDVYDTVTVTVYNWSPKQITFTLPKALLSEWLGRVTDSDYEKDRLEVKDAIAQVEEFIQKVQCLTTATQEKYNDESMADAFDRIIGLKSKARLQRSFYILWFLMFGIEKDVIEERADVIADDVMTFLELQKFIEKEEDRELKDVFRQRVSDLWHRYA